jgi:hypothetical protein
MSPEGPQKWSWWYDGIIDWMIAHPGGKLKDCAADLNRSPNTISYVVNCDAFRDRLAQRREEFKMWHDFTIISKTQEVAVAALDAMLVQLQTKRDKIPLKDSSAAASTALQALGFGAKPGANVEVNVGPGAGQKVLNVSRETLEKSRASIRQLEHAKIGQAAERDAPPTILLKAEEEDASLTPNAA